MAHRERSFNIFTLFINNISDTSPEVKKIQEENGTCSFLDIAEL